MEILPRFFADNSYGLLTNSDIESLYYTTMSSSNQSTIQPIYKKSAESSTNNEIDCTVHVEVEPGKKVSRLIERLMKSFFNLKIRFQK